MRNQGFQDDDDNGPGVENIPEASIDVGDKLVYEDWGRNGIFPRKVDGWDSNREAKIKEMGSKQLTFYYIDGFYFSSHQTAIKY